MASQNMATFHTAIFTRDGSLGLTVAECATSSAAVVQSVKPGGAAQSRRVKPGDVIYAVGFAGTRRLSDDITEEKGAVNRRVEVHMMPYAPPGRL